MARSLLTQENGIWADQLPAPSEITVSPALLWLIVSVAAIFFISGILHILLRFFKKKPSYNNPSVLITQSDRYTQQSLGRQLQQLFRLQDSGLDQSFIDNLPVFNYKEIIIIGSQQYPFDCAVCLCEFSPDDKLRLIPICSHAFHTHCIDTWLLSNSTCPLCRVNLGIQVVEHHRSCNNNRNVRPREENVISVPIPTTNNNIQRVLSVRLGKLENFNGEERSSGVEGSSRRCNLDERRCFSMGSFRYVVNNMDLEVSLTSNVKKDDVIGCGKSEEDGDHMDERKIKYDQSFSVSKVWLFSSKKPKISVSSSETQMGGVSSVVPFAL
ncbi:hypothetical protein Lser_V15G21464 [Lactuca serriola]